MNSLNHYTYGSIVEWMYRNMCGINPLEEYPGYRKIRLAPQPDNRLQYAKASLNTAVGLYESSWCYKENGLYYQFTIPFHAQADLLLMNAEAETVTINGKSLESGGFSYTQTEHDLQIPLKAGKYEVFQKIPILFLSV